MRRLATKPIMPTLAAAELALGSTDNIATLTIGEVTLLMAPIQKDATDTYVARGYLQTDRSHGTDLGMLEEAGEITGVFSYCLSRTNLIMTCPSVGDTTC